MRCNFGKRTSAALLGALLMVLPAVLPAAEKEKVWE